MACRHLPGPVCAVLATGLLLLCLASFAQAVPPNAPTNLRGTILDASDVAIVWDDNSSNESGFVIAYSVNGGGIQSTTVPTNQNSAVFPVSGINTLDFYVCSYAGTTANASAFIGPIRLNFTNNTPGNMAAANRPDGTVLLMWSDNSYAEAGYSIEYAVGAGSYSVLGTVGANPTGISIPNLAPNTNYNFRVRGFTGSASSPTFITNYPLTPATITTLSTLAAPTGLAAIASTPVETSVKFTFTDNTALNNGYAIEYGLHNSGTFVALGDGGDVSPIDGSGALAPGTAYDFRIRAFYDPGGGGTRTYSAYSNVASYTTPFNAPTGLAATVASETQVNLTWADNSSAEQGYSVYYSLAGANNYTLYNFTGPNATSISVTGLAPGTAYDFQVASAFQRTVPGTSTLVESTRSNTASATTKDGFTSAPFIPVTYGQVVNYQSSTTNVSPRTSWNATGLPNGLNFNSSTGVITGTPTQSGLFTVNLTAHFTNGWDSNFTLTLRIIRPPTAPSVAAPLTDLNLYAGASPSSVSAAATFGDADFESAVRLVTTKGNIDVMLYNAETPATVTNFLGYVNRGDYANSAFHRISDVATSGVAVLQGGQIKPTSTAADTFTAIPLQTAVQNEPGISNLNYTIAMAKQGGNPNSATDQFYFNLTDADNVLDAPSQNGGFTVFGRVTNATKVTLDAISTSPSGGPYSINLDGTSTNTGFKWPMNVANQGSVPATMDNTKIMKIISVAPITSTQALTLSVSSSTPAVATAVMNGATGLTITPVAAGTAVITVTATDLDGLTNSTTFNVTVNDSLAQWAANKGLNGGQAAPTADPDGDGHSNLEEFAFLTDPTISNNVNATSYATADASGVKYGRITFPVRKFAPDLTYTVEASDTLAAGSWTPLWTSADGFSAPVVISAVDQTDRTVVTVQDTQASPPATRRFLRVKITTP